MPLFGGPPRDPHKEERDRRSQEQLARGGLPLSAESRLRDWNKRPGFFTSTLSVNEFVLGVDDGVRPLGQVSGSSVYHVGWQYAPMYASAELSTHTRAHTEVRRLALARLQTEAAHMGAHGVVGVRLAERWLDEHVLEFSALGTAIALDTAKEAPPAPQVWGEETLQREAHLTMPFKAGAKQEPLHGTSSPQTWGAGGALPFLSALSGQDFWTLRRAGFMPVGIAAGLCSYYHVATYTTQAVTSGGVFGGGWAGSTELTDYTQATYTARHLATQRMEKEAARVGAEGIVGVDVQMSVRTTEVETNNVTRRDLRVFFSALGTAVASRRDRWPVIDYSLPLSQ